MLYLIIGGSASGKSEYAEKAAVTRYRDAHKLMGTPADRSVDMYAGTLTYVAAMYPYDEECKKRIARHRSLRKDKGFQTAECYTHLEKLTAEKGDVLLIECMSNLLANEMYQESGSLGWRAEQSAGQGDGYGIQIEMSGGNQICAENNGRKENVSEESCGEEYNRKESGRMERTERKQLWEQDDELYWQEKVEEVVIAPIMALVKKASCVVVVTNDVFSEGTAYEEETKKYCRLLGYINRQLARKADGVVEVVCGIPIPVKGELPC